MFQLGSQIANPIKNRDNKWRKIDKKIAQNTYMYSLICMEISKAPFTAKFICYLPIVILFLVLSYIAFKRNLMTNFKIEFCVDCFVKKEMDTKSKGYSQNLCRFISTLLERYYINFGTITYFLMAILKRSIFL